VLLPLLIAIALPLHPVTVAPQFAAARAAVEAPAKKKKSGKAKIASTSKSAAKSTAKSAAKSTAKSTKAARAATSTRAVTSRATRIAASVSSGSLAENLEATIGRAGGRGQWGVMVVSLTNGDTLFARGSDIALKPASTMKLFTSALALDRFGAAGQFETEVLRAGALGSDGVLRGDLVLRGAGDPTMAGRGTHDSIGPAMDVLARRISAAGVRRVTGSVLGDASAFEARRVPDGWLKRYLSASYAARVSALSFNENKITLVVRAEGGRAELAFQPAVTGLPLSNLVRVEPGSRGARIGVRQDSAGGVVVSGWIGGASKARDYQFVVENPELFAAGALRAALVAHGVIVDGGARAGHGPMDAVRMTSLSSPTLERIVTQMNGESNNHFAELLFRSVAMSSGSVGTAVNANALLSRFLVEKAHVSPSAVYAADGSGLSTLDRVTPRAMVHLLGMAKKAAWGNVFELSLPVAGRTETLRRRMRYTPGWGTCNAKAGTPNDGASRGGEFTARNGEELAFSFIYNGRDRWRAKDAMDKMGVQLATFAR